VAINDVYRLTLKSITNANVYQNSLYFRMKTATNPSTVTALTLANDWKEALRPTQCNDVVYSQWELRQVGGVGVSYTTDPCNIVGGILLAGGFTGTLAGNDATDMLPPQCACVITLITGFAGRRRRGRFYYYGLSEQQQASGNWTGGLVAAVEAVFAGQVVQYGAAGTDADFEWNVWSSRTATGCAPNVNPPFQLTPVDTPNPGDAYRPVTTTVVRGTVFTQRRRTPGVGQ
jgi:hypothetical protein